MDPQQTIADLQRQLDERTAERDEALEQQTATAEVLQVINSSPGDLAPVFQAIVEKAHALCDAAYGSLQLWDGEKFRGVAMRGFSDPMVEALRRGYSPSDMPCQRLVEGESIAHCVDLAEIDSPTAQLGGVALAGIRTILYVALRKDDVLLGQIVAARKEVRPFSENEIGLVERFAAQAVIAIENARLITETREALEQQTATAEVLQVINASPGDLAPVFDTMLEKALELCDAAFGLLFNHKDGQFEIVAQRAVPQAFLKARAGRQRPTSPQTTLGRVLNGEDIVRFSVSEGDALYQSGDAHRRALVDAAGARVGITISLRKDEALLGAITVYRREDRPFTDKQIALLQNFAAQAVIAMENARLINETREALDQQTATAEVLQVINASPGVLAPVFDAMLERAMRLCDAVFGMLYLYDGECFRAVATGGVPEAAATVMRQPHPPPGFLMPIMAGEALLHLADVAAFAAPEEAINRASMELSGTRTLLVVPLRKDGVLLGTIAVFRQEVRPFTDKQIALLQNFAAQAVIAMENARLITETREALDQQTATAEVLQVINSSPGDLTPVFDAMLEKATTLCEAVFGQLLIYNGETYQVAALRGVPEFAATMRGIGPFRPPSGSALSRLAEGSRFVHISDITADAAYGSAGDANARVLLEVGKCRTLLTVGLYKDDELIGAISVYRQEVRPFTAKQIALLENFAAQAVIAIENARLITETREALDQQTATAEVLQVINSSPGDLAPVFDAMLDNALRLCEAAHGHFLTYDGEAFHSTAAVRGEPHFAEYWRQQPPFRPAEGNPLLRLVRGEPVVHRADAREDHAYHDRPAYRRMIDLGGIRTSMMVPLRKDGTLLGAIRVYRREVRPFTDKQIALLQNFAAQAVIAMENARLITETQEALDQQTATAEVLQVINSSPGDLAPVFDTILEKAHTLCGAAHGALVTYDGEHFRAIALREMPERFGDLLRQQFRPPPGSPQERLLEGESLIHIPDVATREPTTPIARASVGAGVRTLLMVPLRKDDALLGYITAHRREVRPFSHKQIALLQNFAAQAVIAMENARLITETREALDQQTATAEVLQVINSSPGDLTPVFDAMLEKAIRLCDAIQGALWIIDGERGRLAATQGLPAEFVELLRKSAGTNANPPLQRIMRGERLIQFINPEEEELYKSGNPLAKAAVEAGIRSLIWVALVKDDAPVGAFAIGRREVRPFSDKEIALLQNFAAQAVIAMENARLITETREALEQQTATAEVLGVINSSPGDLAPVFDTMLEKAMRLCDAKLGFLSTYDGQLFDAVAMYGVPEAYAAEFFAKPYTPAPGTTHDLIVKGEEVVHITDLTANMLDSPRRRAVIEMLGVRTILGIALRKEGKLVGALHVYRQEVRPFTEKQIALLQNFAAQAVIAMENARLIIETREALEQQTATAEVLQVINSSPGDLVPVFDAILEKAHRLCGATQGALLTYDGDRFRAVATRGMPEAFASVVRGSFQPHPENPVSALVRGEPLLHVLDIAEVAARTSEDNAMPRMAFQLGGVRTLLMVPLRKDDTLLGVIGAYRTEVRAFTEKEIALLQSFAAQAVIAMENARLITETREARDDAETALRDLKAAQANLIQAEKMASLGQLTAGIAHEIKNPLNFVNNFASLSVELLDELKEATEPAVAALSADQRAEVDETMVMLSGNLEKIAEHGKRADNIVKSMLEHSRGVTGERREVDLNNLIDEALNLAYHGARAQDQSFNIALERDYASALKPIELAPQEITRVFLNLFGNGFYATTKRARENGDGSFRPVLTVATRDLGAAIEVRVRDNGTGIPPEIKDKLFQPFFTTKPTGEGTGLGLSISYDIVTQQHGGTITVESEPGAFTEFTIRLPRQ